MKQDVSNLKFYAAIDNISELEVKEHYGQISMHTDVISSKPIGRKVLLVTSHLSKLHKFKSYEEPVQYSNSKYEGAIAIHLGTKKVHDIKISEIHPEIHKIDDGRILIEYNGYSSIEYPTLEAVSSAEQES